MVESALRGVMREALARAAASGLPGAHHFFIGFKTRFPGVKLPDSLLEQYSDEMTIVLEHQFWDLEVAEDKFAVTLSFQNRPDRLTIPFEAVTTFNDPSVKFGLQFHPGDGSRRRILPRPRRRQKRKPKRARKPARSSPWIPSARNERFRLSRAFPAGRGRYALSQADRRPYRRGEPSRRERRHGRAGGADAAGATGLRRLRAFAAPRPPEAAPPHPRRPRGLAPTTGSSPSTC